MKHNHWPCVYEAVAIQSKVAFYLASGPIELNWR